MEDEESKSSFLEAMGDAPINRVVDFLITYDEFDYSLTDIAENAGVGYSTLMLFWSKLEEKKIVKFTRKVGKAKMYQLNKSNPAVKILVQFWLQIAKEEVHRLLEEPAGLVNSSIVAPMAVE